MNLVCFLEEYKCNLKLELLLQNDNAMDYIINNINNDNKLIRLAISL